MINGGSHNEDKANHTSAWGNGLLNKLRATARSRRKRLADKIRRQSERRRLRADLADGE